MNTLERVLITLTTFGVIAAYLGFALLAARTVQ